MIKIAELADNQSLEELVPGEIVRIGRHSHGKEFSGDGPCYLNLYEGNFNGRISLVWRKFKRINDNRISNNRFNLDEVMVKNGNLYLPIRFGNSFYKKGTEEYDRAKTLLVNSGAWSFGRRGN